MGYNGWKSDYLSCVFLFLPSERTAAAVFNDPGGMHNSQRSELRGVYDKLESFYLKTETTILVDSEFEKSSYSCLFKLTEHKRKAQSPEEI